VKRLARNLRLNFNYPFEGQVGGIILRKVRLKEMNG
jgi:hypothetical protein